MDDGTAPFREAGPEDAAALLELERSANLVALAHVFAPEEHPYPDREVLARWEALLADEEVVVLVLEDPERPGLLRVLVAADAQRVRHLAVHPRWWGRGLARRALGQALPVMTDPRLWVLEANHRARGLYEHLGWRATGRQQRAEFPPHPPEIELALAPVLVVDGANVVGSRPDGWWRDRAGAASRLHARLVAATDEWRVVLVLEGRARDGVAEGTPGAVTVVHAPGSGDDTIVAEAARAVRLGAVTTVVTADRALADRVRALGAGTERPGRLLERLDAAD